MYPNAARSESHLDVEGNRAPKEPVDPAGPSVLENQHCSSEMQLDSDSSRFILVPLGVSRPQMQANASLRSRQWAAQGTSGHSNGSISTTSTGLRRLARYIIGVGADPHEILNVMSSHVIDVASGARSRRGVELALLRLSVGPFFRWSSMLTSVVYTLFLVYVANRSASCIRAEYSQHPSRCHNVGNLIDIDLAFLALFSLEVLVKVIGNPKKLWLKRARQLDVFVLTIWICDQLIVRLHGRNRMEIDLLLATALRSLRVTRAVRVLSVIRYFNTLRLVLKSLSQCLIYAYASVLLISIYLLFITVGYLLYAKPQEAPKYETSSTVPNKMSDVFGENFQTVVSAWLDIIFSGREWGDCCLRSLVTENYAGESMNFLMTSMMFLGVFVAYMGVLPVIGGCFLELMSQAADQEKEYELMQKRMVSPPVKALRSILFGETLEQYRNPVARRRIQWRGIELALLANQNIARQMGWNNFGARSIFQRLDAKGTGYVDINEFLHMFVVSTSTRKKRERLSVEFTEYLIQRRASVLERRIGLDIDKQEKLFTEWVLTCSYVSRRFLKRVGDLHEGNGIMLEDGTLKRKMPKTTCDSDGQQDDEAGGAAEEGASAKEPRPTPSTAAAICAVEKPTDSKMRRPWRKTHHPLMYGWFDLLQAEGQPFIRRELVEFTRHKSRLSMR